MTEITEICDKGSLDERLIWPHTVRSKSSTCNHTTGFLQILPQHITNRNPGLCGAQGLWEGQLNFIKGF